VRAMGFGRRSRAGQASVDASISRACRTLTGWKSPVDAATSAVLSTALAADPFKNISTMLKSVRRRPLRLRFLVFSWGLTLPRVGPLRFLDRLWL
jgi:hypothetical protein